MPLKIVKKVSKKKDRAMQKDKKELKKAVITILGIQGGKVEDKKVTIFDQYGNIKKTMNTVTRVRSSPIIFDLDMDGTKEIIVADSSKVYVWNCNGNPFMAWPNDYGGCVKPSHMNEHGAPIPDPSPAVGDIDVDEMEAKIKTRFGGINYFPKWWLIDFESPIILSFSIFEI